MQLHKIAANGDRIELTLIEPEPGGQPTYTVVVQSIEEFPAWISKAQLALDSAKRERSLIAQRRKSDIQRQLQQLQLAQKALEAQLLACDAPDEVRLPDRVKDLVNPEVSHLIIHNSPVFRAGPPSARGR
jgi:hypothetical protein